MANDQLFNEMMTFARQDVSRAVKTKGLKKKDWQKQLQEFGLKRANELKFAATDFDIERKAIWISGRLWYAAAKRESVAPKPKSKGSSWGWKKHIADQGHVADAAARWAHLKGI